MPTDSKLTITALPNIPLIQRGDDLVAIILRGLGEADIAMQNEDVLVLASKIVSKAEGRVVRLTEVQASGRAEAIARETGKDPREIELMLRESSEVVRTRMGLVITRHRLGFVCANAGIDHSNVEGGGQDFVILLPENPDATAHQIRAELAKQTGKRVGVVIADSHGRPHRTGTMGVAIGCAGLPGLEDQRGRSDLFGYVLQHTEIALADMIASAGTLLLGQSNEGRPVVHLRGIPFVQRNGSAQELVRAQEADLFL
ncbi:MAG TPA: coenzyme F420-0:L-glutamate ligase [Anaerolineae bacterium]